MKQCLALASNAANTGNYPLGSIVVRNGVVLSAVSSSLAAGHDPTAHPEMSAIRMACELQASRYLPGAILVSTLEPCPMCTSAAIWAKFDGIIFGASQEDALAWSKAHRGSRFSWRQISLKSQTVAECGDPKPWVQPHVMREECKKLFDL